MGEDSLTRCFGLQIQFKLTSIGDERSIFLFILKQLVEKCF